MSPRTGRPPSDNPKRNETRIRMSDDEKRKLEHCCNYYKLTKAQIIRLGVDYLYDKSMEEMEDIKKRIAEGSFGE